MRFPAIPILILLLLFISAAVVVPNSLRLGAATQDLLSTLAQEAGLEVRFEQDIESSVRLRVLPRPQLILTNLTVANRGQTAARVSARLPRLIVDLDMGALVQRRFEAKSVWLLNADIRAHMSQAPEDFLGSLLSMSHPGLYFLDSRVDISGLNARDVAKSVQAPSLSLALPRRAAGAPLKLSMRHKLANNELARFTLFLTQHGPQSRSPRVEIWSELALAVNEKLSFEGFVSPQANWRLDGELSLSSFRTVADLFEQHLPIKISPEARAVSFSGLVRGDATGIRSQNLEISALNTLFQSRLALDWPPQKDETGSNRQNRPLLVGRLSTGSLNLDALRAAPLSASSPPIADHLWRSFAPDLGMGLRLEANQFELGGETGSDLVLAFDWRGEEVDIERLSLNLPFRSALLAVGKASLGAPTPRFKGSFSARSSDGLAAMIWAGDQFSADVSGFAETVDPSRLQRVSLVGDVEWGPENLQLTQFSGRLEDDRVSGKMTLGLGSALNVNANLTFSRLDMNDWGMADGQTNRALKLASVWQPLNRAMESWLQAPNAQRKIDLSLATDQLYSGAQSFGPLQMQTRISDQTLDLTSVRLGDFNGAEIIAQGRMNYSASQPHGDINVQFQSIGLSQLAAPGLRRFVPLSFPPETPISLTGNLRLSAPDAPDWPDVEFSGLGDIGDLTGHFNIITPSRSMDYGVSGSTVLLSLEGAANAVAQTLSLPSQYDETAEGRVQISLNTQSADVSALRADLLLSDDKAQVSGRLRPSADGPRLEGALSFTTTDVVPFFGLAPGARKLSASARGQVNASALNIGFSGFEGLLGEGKIKADGVLQRTGPMPQLTADVILEGSDLTWLLPEWRAKGWSQATLDWPLLGTANADMNLRLLNTNLGPVPIDSAVARLKLIEGVLEAPEIKLQLLGGELTANLQAEGGSLNPFFNLDASFAQIRPPSFGAAKSRNNIWDAPHNGTLGLRGRGTSVAAMMGSLSGALQVEVGSGAFTFLNLDQLAAELALPSYDGKAADLVARLSGAGETAFERGVGVAQIRSGRVETAKADFIFAAPRGEASLIAQVDLLTREVLGRLQVPIIGPDRAIIWDITGDVAKPKVTLGAARLSGVSSPPAPSSE